MMTIVNDLQLIGERMRIKHSLDNVDIQRVLIHEKDGQQWVGSGALSLNAAPAGSPAQARRPGSGGPITMLLAATPSVARNARRFIAGLRLSRCLWSCMGYPSPRGS